MFYLSPAATIFAISAFLMRIQSSSHIIRISNARLLFVSVGVSIRICAIFSTLAFLHHPPTNDRTPGTITAGSTIHQPTTENPRIPPPDPKFIKRALDICEKKPHTRITPTNPAKATDMQGINILHILDVRREFFHRAVLTLTISTMFQAPFQTAVLQPAHKILSDFLLAMIGFVALHQHILFVTVIVGHVAYCASRFLPKKNHPRNSLVVFGVVPFLPGRSSGGSVGSLPPRCV
ncbi:hypothetical protein FPV67DRAFT_1460813 [Lyophyllum atratum]|nr:hypothetical protein FPV67DRAFT_1460813 [Lyophyllum atratum]